MFQLLSRNGNRRFFITLLLVVAFVLLAWLDVKSDYVLFIGGAMSSALTFWFSQHDTKPSSPPQTPPPPSNHRSTVERA